MLGGGGGKGAEAGAGKQIIVWGSVLLNECVYLDGWLYTWVISNGDCCF